MATNKLALVYRGHFFFLKISTFQRKKELLSLLLLQLKHERF